MDTAVLLNQKRANVCELTTRMESLEFFKGATRGLREEWMEVNAQAVSRGQNELVCKFKMAVGDMISISINPFKFPSIHSSRNPLVAPLKNSTDAILVMCSHTFALF